MTDRMLLKIVIVFIGILSYGYDTKGQTQEAFGEKFQQIVINASDSSRARTLAIEAYNMVEDSESLQTLSNYSILVAIFTNQVPDQSLQEISQKKANALVSFTPASIDKPTAYDNAQVEWVYEYQLELYKSQDNRLGAKALKFLEAHGDLQNYMNYAAIATFYENLGDFNKANELYDLALNKIDYARKEVVSIYAQAYFYLKSGQYERIDELLELNQSLLNSADEYTSPAYESTGDLIRMLYYVSTGDYFNYIKASDDYYGFYIKNYPDPNGLNPYSQTSYSNRGLGFESIGDWEQADENWKLADEAKLEYYRKLQELYPNYPDYYLSGHSFFKAKRGTLENYEDAIRELDTHYKLLASNAPLLLPQLHVKAQYLGHYKDSRYKSLLTQLIQESRSAKDFILATRPMTDLAFFDMRDGNYNASAKLYKALFKENIDWINDIIFNFGEKAFVAYFNTKLQEGYDNYHSFVRLAKEKGVANLSEMSGQAYNNLLLTKSIAFKSVRRRKKAFINSNSPGAIEKYNDWIKKKQELIRLYQMSQINQQDIEGVLKPDNQATDNSTQIKFRIDRDSLEVLQKEVDNLENSLANEAKGFETTLKIAASDWKKVRAGLEPGEAAVEIVRFDWRDQVYYSDTAYYAAYVIKHDSKYPEVIYLNALAEALDTRFYKFYRNAVRLKTEDNTSYQQYWAPIKQGLEGIKKVYFSSDGIYHLISLPTLKNPSTGQYLIDEVDITYVASTSDIINTVAYQKLEDAVLIGRPKYAVNIPFESVDQMQTRSLTKNFRNANITDLPGTESEVNEIKQQLLQKGIDVKQYLGVNAMEDVIHQLRSPSILHIATHGFWSGVDNATSAYRMFNAMVNSGLLLAGVVDYYSQTDVGGEHDGILTAYEAQSLDLENTELVILSACETGLGDFDAGEGVYGLQRAFRAAGAKSVITSLWQVDDAGTKDFMVSFYSHLTATGDKALAFSKAQQEIKAKYKHPYYWGAFMLMGE